MGIFLNRGYEDFESAINSQIYVDKTDVIAYFNRLVKTEHIYGPNSVVLAGINYDKKTKKHSCTIERISVNEENYSD